MNELPKLPDVEKIEKERTALHQLKNQGIIKQEEYDAACMVYRRSVLLCIHALEMYLIDAHSKMFPNQLEAAPDAKQTE